MQYEEFGKLIHENILQQLKFIDFVCKKEDIKYSLMFGTLIGAVRHNGFIPWDDDADIVMPRVDFCKFMAVIDKYTEDSPFMWDGDERIGRIRHKEPFVFNGEEYSAFVDFFILDNVPDDERKLKRHLFKLKTLQGMMKKGKLDWSKYSFKEKILVWGTRVLGMFCPTKKLLKKYDKLSVKYNTADTKWQIISNDLYQTLGTKYDSTLLKEFVNHQFEDEQLLIFKHYDEILTQYYGDYMTPPPLEEQRFIHLERGSFKVKNKENFHA